jgi:uncharacterized BrkB/YihY/UPF0761 family membrane protein
MKSVAAEAKTKRRFFSGRKAAWAGIIALLLLALALVVIPMRVIHPFRPQTPGGLELAYTLRQWSPIITLLVSVIIIALTLWLWRGARRWWRKSLLVAFVALSVAVAWFARQNIFEWMFNPQPDASYARIADASFVDDSDRVIAIEISGDAVAYPVRQIAYHHVVEDTVGGVPVVATY